MIEPFSLPPELIAELQQVERIVIERVHTQPAVVSVAGQQLGDIGQPRLRATLVLLAARLGSQLHLGTIHAAAAVELIHAATHTHDLLIDEAERRRSPQGEQGNWPHGVSLMVGDYLFALAAGEMALAADPRVIAFYSQAVMALCAAELEPPRLLSPLTEAREGFFQSQRGVTAALFIAAAKAGGACAALSDAEIEQLARFGEHLGLALRVAADLRDWEGAELPRSLRRGVLSLPLIEAAAHRDPLALRLALDRGTQDDFAAIVSAVRTDGLTQTQVIFGELQATALAALSDLPDTPARALLEELTRHAAHLQW